VLRSSEQDQVTLVGAGVTVHTCLGAADLLAEEGISARVIDCYSVKPIDTATLAAAVDATGGRIVVAEDHHPEGGLGSAVTDALLAAGRVGPVAGPPRCAWDAGLRVGRRAARLGRH
jgi:transketolase